MFEAQLLIQAASAYSVFSPWFPRQSDHAVFTIETVNRNGGGVNVEIFTKNSETAGNGSNAGGTTFSSPTGAGERNESGADDDLLEMVRYKFTVTGSAGDWILFRMLPPVWFDAVKA